MYDAVVILHLANRYVFGIEASSQWLWRLCCADFTSRSILKNILVRIIVCAENIESVIERIFCCGCGLHNVECLEWVERSTAKTNNNVMSMNLSAYWEERKYMKTIQSVVNSWIVLMYKFNKYIYKYLERSS